MADLLSNIKAKIQVAGSKELFLTSLDDGNSIWLRDHSRRLISYGVKNDSILELGKAPAKSEAPICLNISVEISRGKYEDVVIQAAPTKYIRELINDLISKHEIPDEARSMYELSLSGDFELLLSPSRTVASYNFAEEVTVTRLTPLTVVSKGSSFIESVHQ